MGLGGKIVYLIGLHHADDIHQRRRIRKVAVMERYRVLGDEMVYPFCIGHGGPPYYPVYFISLFQQKFRQIRAILSCDTCDQCFLHYNALPGKYLKLSSLYQIPLIIPIIK